MKEQQTKDKRMRLIDTSQMRDSVWVKRLLSPDAENTLPDAINRILSHNRTWGITDYHASQLPNSGFPETGRLIWLMPSSDGGFAVIEVPTDDAKGINMMHALNLVTANLWSKVYSDRCSRKMKQVADAICKPVPADPTYYRPIQADFARVARIENADITRSGMQLHSVASVSACERTKSFVGQGGAVCSAMPSANSPSPASEGCGFVSRLHCFDGLRYSDLYANAVFSMDNAGLGDAAIFNFDGYMKQMIGLTENDPRFCVLAALRMYTRIARGIYGRKQEA